MWDREIMQEDHRYLELAWQQHGLVAHRQLLDLGFTPSAITRRRRAGLLRDVTRGLYAVAGAPTESFEATAAAAILQTPRLAAASHVTAARLLGMRGWSRETAVHVTVPRPAHPRSDRAEIHRSEIFDRSDIVQPSAVIPLTRPERTIVGIVELQPARATAALDEATLSGLTTTDRLWRYLTRYGGRGCPGAAATKEALHRKAPRERPHESDLEREWVAALHRFGLRDWRPQVEVITDDGKFRLDLAHARHPVVVEFDSRLWHSSEEDYRRERRKRYALAKAGYRLFPVTEFDLHERAGDVAADLLALIAELDAADLARVDAPPALRHRRFLAPFLPHSNAS